MPEKKKYLYNYQDKQTPTERIRNKLSSIFTLVQVIGNPRAKELINDNAIRVANEDLEAVRDLIADIETDYDFYEQQLKDCQNENMD